MLESNALNAIEFNSPSQENNHQFLALELILDYQKLAAQVIVALRGDLTQRQLSRLLGFSFNQVGKWESCVTQMKWDSFLNLCKVLKLPIENHFRFLFCFYEEDFTALSSLRGLNRVLNFNEIENESSSATKKKWLSGQIVPDLSEVFKIMGKKSPLLFGLLSLIVSCEKIPLLKEPYQEFLKNLDAVLDDPLVVYVNAALQLEEYKNLEYHDEKFLAEHAACSVPQGQIALQNLVKHGLVIFDGKKYHPNPFDFSFSGLRHVKLRGLTKHTSILAARRYPVVPVSNDPLKVKNMSAGSVRVVAMSKESSKKVTDLIAKFHVEVGQIINQDKLPKDNVQVILVHSFTTNFNSK